MHKNSKEPLDKPMIFLEQTWVFWLGDNTEDLEMGAKCAERAAKMLAGDYMEALAWFWRFKCEHRLLCLQVQEAMRRAGEEQVQLRKEKEGMPGEDEREPEPTPAYKGLELSVQQNLTHMLETCVSIWCNQSFTVTDWMDTNTMCHFMLAVGFQLELMGHSGINMFRKVVNISETHSVNEEITIVAMTELIKVGDHVDVDKVMIICEKLTSDKKPSLGCLPGLAIALMLKNKGCYSEAAHVLNSMLDCKTIYTTTSTTEYNIKSRAKLELSKLKLRLDHKDTEDRFCLEGPLELTSEAYKLVDMCYRWLEEAKTEPHNQEPRLLWLLPYVAIQRLECLDHLASLYRTISSPLLLKCYVKTALTSCQEECLPLRTADYLVKLASTNLLCDDEVGAKVQIDGVQFILGDIMDNKADKIKVLHLIIVK